MKRTLRSISSSAFRLQVPGAISTTRPVNLYTMLPSGRYDPKDVAQDIAQLFTGIRIQCSQCHNHPFDRLVEEDYYGFCQLLHGRQAQRVASEAREVFIYDDVNAPPAKHLLDEHPVPARYLGRRCSLM